MLQNVMGHELSQEADHRRTVPSCFLSCRHLERLDDMTWPMHPC
jgi:hypothetical protein